MGFAARLFVPLFAVLAATGSWLLIEHEHDTIFAIDSAEEAAPISAVAKGGS